MKQKLLSLFVALVATTALWASNTITYMASAKLSRSTLNVGATTFGPAITDHAFSNGTGTITCSGEITTIGGRAFESCTNLTSITIPNSVTTIGEWAFFNCYKLTSITIPNSVTTIGSHAFYICDGLTSVTIGNSVTTIGDDAFHGCYDLTSVTIPNSVTTIGDDAFHGCYDLTSVTIGNSVTTIGDDAFYGCYGLISVTIPNSVTKIGRSAFYGVRNIIYSGSATGAPWGARCLNGVWDGYLLYADNTKTKLCACDPTATGRITIPSSVTTIGERAFYNCSKLTSITIPYSVTTIGNSAFYNCSGLTSITIPYSVTTIGNSAFYNCSGLTSITIPNSVTTIGSNAFYNCSGLISITIPNSVTTIGDEAFGDCSGLTSITIPNSVTKIGTAPFYGCTGLTSINVNAANKYYTSVDGVLFNYAKDTLIQYPVGNSRTHYDIPSNVTTIGDYAFFDCHNLTSVTIPNSVTTIGDDAFHGCGNLTTITCYATTPPACRDGECFGEWWKLLVYVPSRSLSVYQSTYPWSKLNLQANPNVYVAVDYDATKGTVTGAGNYKIGDQCTISVTPYDHFHFVQWNDGNKTNPRTFVVTQDTSFTAQIDEDVFTLTAQSDDNTKGTVSGGGTYPYGTQVQLTATCNDHCYFVQWSDGVKTNPRTVTVVGDATYTAHFSIDQYTITATTTNGIVTGSGIYDYGTEAALTVIPNVGYEFTTWSDGNPDNPRIVSVTEDATYNCICTQMTAGKCGNNLYWEYKEGKLIITGTGEMYDYAVNEMPWYLYRDNVQHVEFSAGLTYIGCNAFTNFIRIEEITCFANQSPRVCSTTFDGLSKQYIYLYVPADYIRSYQVNPSWNEFDIRTKSADVTPLNNDKPAVSPTDNDVTITWPINNDAETYTLTITKNGEDVCVLTFNSNGQLINIAFAAPGHNGAHQAPAATLTAQGYQFTVTGLNPGTSYNYSVIATNAGGKTIAKHKGEFSTTGGTGFETVHGSQCTMHKVLRNGQILLERNNATYTLTGQKVL